jgi:D-alanine-D-alanine ligase-like ATP-grasp enzyme
MSTPATVTTCLKCGNNPTPHLVARIDTVIMMILNPMVHAFLRTFFARPLVVVMDIGYMLLLKVGQALGVMRFVDMEASLGMDRGEVLATEARARGYTVQVLKIGRRTQDTYRIVGTTGKSIIFSGVPRVDRVNVIASGWMDDKWQIKKCLMKGKLPVSKGANVFSWRGALAVFRRIEKPVIVKPRFGSRGRHTTTFIYTEAELREAYTSARQLSWPVIVEEHLIGSVYRATCVDGELVGVLAGDPPRITGDGVHTIDELITLKNDTRPDRVGEVKRTTKLDEFLTRQGYTRTTVLPKGLRIDVSEKIGLSYGGCSREDTSVTHPKLKAELSRAAKVVGDPLLGFDFISPDITVDPDTVKWGIIECNSVPFINLHHDPLEGTPVNAAAAVLDSIEQSIKLR